jgi:hypothetical protein
MLNTYRCRSCGTTWTSEQVPIECRCRSRLIESLPAPGMSHPYAAPLTAGFAEPGDVKDMVGFGITYWIGMASFFLMGVFAALSDTTGEGNNLAGLVVILLVIGLGCLIAAVILGLLKVHRAWRLVQPLRQADPTEADMPTPGTAIGLLFVPLFNFYWVFVCYYGLMNRVNKLFSLRMYNVRPANSTLALWMCILIVVGIVPGIGTLAALPNIILIYMFIHEVNRVGNVLATEGREA